MTALDTASVGVSLYGTSYNGVVVVDVPTSSTVGEKGSELVSRMSINVGCRNLTKYTLESPLQSPRVTFTCRYLISPVIDVLFFVQ